MGDAPFATEYEDYRDAGSGVKMPFTVNVVGPSRPDCAQMKFDKIELNASIDASKLAKPQPSALTASNTAATCMLRTRP